MQKRIKLYLTFSAIVILISILYLFTNWFSIITGYFSGEDSKARLVQCLNEKDAEFYGTLHCAECEKQKKELGQAFELVNYIDCGEDKENCPDVREIPAWYIDKKIYYGSKTITELSELSGCPLT